MDVSGGETGGSVVTTGTGAVTESASAGAGTSAAPSGTVKGRVAAAGGATATTAADAPFVARAASETKAGVDGKIPVRWLSRVAVSGAVATSPLCAREVFVSES